MQCSGDAVLRKTGQWGCSLVEMGQLEVFMGRVSCAIIVGVVMGLATTAIAHADWCYLCQEGGYVKYERDDTFAKRKKAKEQFGCTVSGTTSSCANSRGTVAFTDDASPEKHEARWFPQRASSNSGA